MDLRAVVVVALLAAIVIPIVLAEVRRFRPRRAATRVRQPRPAKRDPVAKPSLRLVVNKNDMDRELAALLAKDSRKSPEADE